VLLFAAQKVTKKAGRLAEIYITERRSKSLNKRNGTSAATAASVSNPRNDKQAVCAKRKGKSKQTYPLK